MKSAIVKILESAAIPFGLILLCSVFVRKTGTLTESLSGSIQNAPYIIFFAGMTLSCLFNRNRIFFVLAVLAMSRLALTALAPSGDQRTFYMSVVYPSICAAVPLKTAWMLYRPRKPIAMFEKRHSAMIPKSASSWP